MTSNTWNVAELEEDVPPVHSRAAYGILLLQGFGLLIPWNVILNTCVLACLRFVRVCGLEVLSGGVHACVCLRLCPLPAPNYSRNVSFVLHARVLHVVQYFLLPGFGPKKFE